MKLNINCIRDILLTIEENCDFETPWEYQEDSPDSKFLSNYNHEEIVYHIKQAEKSDLIDGVDYFESGSNIYISDLTPKGHEFLANIRNDTVWKKVLSKASNASLPIILEVAKDAAKKHFLG